MWRHNHFHEAGAARLAAASLAPDWNLQSGNLAIGRDDYQIDRRPLINKPAPNNKT